MRRSFGVFPQGGTGASEALTDSQQAPISVLYSYSRHQDPQQSGLDPRDQGRGFCLARKPAATGRLLLAYRNYHEFARGKPRRTLSSQLSGKLMDSTLSAPCAELAAFWRTGLAELTVAFAKRSLSSRFVGTFTALLPRMLGPRPPRSLPSFTLVSESGRPLKGIRNSGPGCLIFGSCPSSRHLHQLIRARRDRPRSFPRGLQHGARGPGLETSRPPLSRRPIEGLGKREKPQAPSNGARERHVLQARGDRGLVAH